MLSPFSFAHVFQFPQSSARKRVSAIWGDGYTFLFFEKTATEKHERLFLNLPELNSILEKQAVFKTQSTTLKRSSGIMLHDADCVPPIRSNERVCKRGKITSMQCQLDYFLVLRAKILIDPKHLFGCSTDCDPTDWVHEFFFSFACLFLIHCIPKKSPKKETITG